MQNINIYIYIRDKKGGEKERIRWGWRWKKVACKEDEITETDYIVSIIITLFINAFDNTY